MNACNGGGGRKRQTGCSALARGVRGCLSLSALVVISVVSGIGRRTALELTSLRLLWTRPKLFGVTGGVL